MELAVIICILCLALIVGGISYSIIKWKKQIMNKSFSRE